MRPYINKAEMLQSEELGDMEDAIFDMVADDPRMILAKMILLGVSQEREERIYDEILRQEGLS